MNYKSKTEIKVDEHDWVVVRNVHDSIISEETYFLANKMVMRDLKLSSKSEPSIFAGMLYCKECGSPLIRRKVKYKDKENIYYICSHNNKTGECSRHSTNEEEILSTLKSVVS